MLSTRKLITLQATKSIFRTYAQTFSERDKPFKQNSAKTSDQKKAEEMLEKSVTGEQSEYGNMPPHKPMDDAEVKKYAKDSTDTRQTLSHEEGNLKRQNETASQAGEHWDKRMEKDRETARKHQ
jgi:hypothetical protein